MIIEFTPAQSAQCRYPTGCPVWMFSHDPLYDDVVSTTTFQQGIVDSVSMNFETNELFYNVITEQGKVCRAVEADLVFASGCPVNVVSVDFECDYGDGHTVVSGVVLFCKKNSRGAFYTVEWNGTFAENIDAGRVSYRQVGSTASKKDVSDAVEHCRERRNEVAVSVDGVKTAEPKAVCQADKDVDRVSSKQHAVNVPSSRDDNQPTCNAAITENGEVDTTQHCSVDATEVVESLCDNVGRNNSIQDRSAGSNSSVSQMESAELPLEVNCSEYEDNNLLSDLTAFSFLPREKLHYASGDEVPDTKQQKPVLQEKPSISKTESSEIFAINITIPMWIQMYNNRLVQRFLFLHIIGPNGARIKKCQQETNCRIQVNNLQFNENQGVMPPKPMTIDIDQRSATAQSDVAFARRKIEEILLMWSPSSSSDPYIRNDGSKGRLLYEIAAQCEGPHRPIESTSKAVMQRNPFDDYQKECFMSLLELPCKFQIDQQKHLVTIIERQTGCSLKFVGNDYGIPTRYCEPYLLVLGPHWSNVDQAAEEMRVCGLGINVQKIESNVNSGRHADSVAASSLRVDNDASETKSIHAADSLISASIDNERSARQKQDVGKPFANTSSYKHQTCNHTITPKVEVGSRFNQLNTPKLISDNQQSAREKLDAKTGNVENVHLNEKYEYCSSRNHHIVQPNSSEPDLDIRSNNLSGGHNEMQKDEIKRQIQWTPPKTIDKNEFKKHSLNAANMPKHKRQKNEVKWTTPKCHETNRIGKRQSLDDTESLRKQENDEGDNCAVSHPLSMPRDRGAKTKTCNHHDVFITVPPWMQKSISGSRLYGFIVNKGFKNTKIIEEETNCKMQVIMDEIAESQGLPHKQPIRIRLRHPDHQPPQLARNMVENILLNFPPTVEPSLYNIRIKDDGSKGRLLYEAAASCSGPHRPNESTSNAVYQLNPFDAGKNCCFMSLLELPRTVNKVKSIFHGHFLSEAQVVTKVNSLAKCTFVVVGDDFGIKTRFCDPYILVLGQVGSHWRQVDKAIDILKLEIHKHQQNCACWYKY